MNLAPSDQPSAGMNVNSMELRILRSDGRGPATPIEHLPPTPPSAGWVWLDVRVGGDDTTALAVRDAVEDTDLPKVDDFGHHLLVVLHALRDDEIDRGSSAHCSPRALAFPRCIVETTAEPARAGFRGVRRASRPARRRTHPAAYVGPRAARGSPRRPPRVRRRADNTLLGELAGVRRSLAQIRHVVHPQREALDDLRTSTFGLITDAGRRRLSDVFDVAARVGSELESTRTAMAEILEAYRGAEARRATAVTVVLTVYAAIMLPLALVAGYFRMNFDNLPGLGTDWAGSR